MIRAVSFGGGVQSTALLVLAAEGQIDHRLFLFCNVGEDSENPATISYFNEVAMPYAAAHGIELLELRKRMRDGTPDTILTSIARQPRSIPIPMHLAGAGPGNRTCTAHFKIFIVAKELQRRGATPEDPALTALGISVDEFHRARTSSGIAWQTLEYPLIDRRLSRSNCLSIIAKAGLPEPEPSSCYFCPFHTMEQWTRLKRNKPDLWEKAVELEARMVERRRSLGRDPMYMTGAGKPLEEAIGQRDQQMEFDLPGGCASGYCLT